MGELGRAMSELNRTTRAFPRGIAGRPRWTGLLPVIGLLALWQAASSLGWSNAYLLPPPTKVAAAAYRAAESGELGRHVGASLLRVTLGFSLAVVLALPLAILASFAPRLTAAFDPLLTFLRNIPPLALVPVLILWFGIGEASKLALIVLSSFFPVFMGTATGLSSVDPKLIEMGRSLGFSRPRILAAIMLPESVPSIANGLRLGLGYSWRALVGAEMVAASSGLGYWILDAEEMARIDSVFAGILAIGVLGILIDRAAYLVATRLLPWAGLEAQWYA
jgi:sulfonate transport system permease protein